MKIEWKDFASRRKIDINMFKDWSYEKYTEWCGTRSVVPVPKESFEAVKQIATIVKQELPEIPPTIDEKHLKKMKKTEIIRLCKDSQIVLDGNETKAKLIVLLLNKDSN